MAGDAQHVASRVAEREGGDWWRDLGRAFGGALVFALPLLMTMEMWYLGFYLGPWQIAQFMLLVVPMLAGLSHFAGFRRTSGWKEDVLDALVAVVVGLTTAAFFLMLLGVLGLNSVDSFIGRVTLMSVPAALGAMIGSRQLGQSSENRRSRESTGYAGQLFIMAVGALILAFNVAPTEEMILIGFMITPWHAVALMAVTLVLMHTTVYSLGFRGQAEGPEGVHPAQLFYRFTMVGYLLALIVSAYVLWTFGRFEHTALSVAVREVAVLGFPAGLGAALSRLVI